jgi:Mor family transcriptional regulator
MADSQATTTVPAIVEPFDSSFLERAVRDPSFSVEKVSALLAERAKLQHEVQRRAYYAALAEVQENLGEVVRDGDNPAFKSKYATLEALYRAAKPIYTPHGFSMTFGSLKPSQPGFLRISCIVSHRDGHSETYELEAPVSVAGARGNRVAMTDIQAVGAAVTYLRRYLFMMVFNLVQGDDPVDNDGNAIKPKSGLMDKSVQQTVNQAAAPAGKENGNGNGDGNGKPKVADWFDKFQGECDAADTVDEAEAILKRPEVINSDEVFARWPKTVAAIAEVKEALIKRIYQGVEPTEPAPAEDLDEPTPLSHVP